ncbi:MAG: thermonuclease family protein [Henriciella sp.]|nr:thermonuclease family protein [Henriciella sp.]
MRLAALSLFVLLCAACNASSQSVWDKPPAETVTVPASSVRVVDGDTFRANGDKIRLIGWDTPEEGRTRKCDAERELGRKATAAAKQLIENAETVSFIFEGRDRYDRALAHVALNASTDIGAALEAQGLAQRWDYDAGDRKPVWCD